MTQPSEGFTSLADASGVSLAYKTVGSFKIPIFINADDSGHFEQTVPSYTFFIKAQAGAAAKIHFDLFNASGSGKILEMRGLWVGPSLIATVVGTVSPDFDFFRTSAIGTAGTALPYKATTFPNLSPMDTTNAALPSQVTGRAAPTGGATTAEALFTTYVTQEESQAGAQLGQFYNVLPESVMGQRYTLQEGQGFKLVQTTLGVAQNFSFFGLFTLV